MIEFSVMEQEFLRNMIQLHKSQNLCVNSWLSKLFNDKISLKLLLRNLSIDYRIDIEYSGVSQNELLSRIKYFQFLVERLENTHLIKRDLLGNTEFKFDELESKEVYALIAFSNNGLLYNFFSMYWNSPILVSQYIIELVENNFQTSEQLRFKVQLKDANEKHKEAMAKAQAQVKYSRWAFYGSIAALVASSVFGIVQMCSETTIDKDQLNQIKQTIEQKALPDAIKTEITNDTLTTGVVEKPQIRSKKQIKNKQKILTGFKNLSGLTI